MKGSSPPLSDTNGPEIPPQPTPDWEYQQALRTLGIREVPFDSINRNLQGYSHGTEIAIDRHHLDYAQTDQNPLPRDRARRLGPYAAPEPGRLSDAPGRQRVPGRDGGVPVHERTVNELGQLDEETARVSRGYIQHGLAGEHPPDKAIHGHTRPYKAIQQVLTSADCIVRAGRAVADAGDADAGEPAPD